MRSPLFQIPSMKYSQSMLMFSIDSSSEKEFLRNAEDPHKLLGHSATDSEELQVDLKYQKNHCAVERAGNPHMGSQPFS